MIIGFVGWRGMVGSVLMQRMIEEEDFDFLEDNNCAPIFFSSSKNIVNQPLTNFFPFLHFPIDPNSSGFVHNSADLKLLAGCDVIVTCQGGDWSKETYPKLINDYSWKGIWLDASSAFRQEKDCMIVLDPINGGEIKENLSHDWRKFAGGNCTVSLMLMALHGLFKEDLIECVDSKTYQAASGAGARAMLELGRQTSYLAGHCDLDSVNLNPLKMEKQFTACLRGFLPTENLKYPLAGSVLPFIDSETENGQSREEWKGQFETNKILGFEPQEILVDGICVRVPVLRCHSQALTIKLKKNVPMDEIEQILFSANEFVEVVPNTKEATLSRLTPAAVSGKLKVPIGRLRKSNFGQKYLNAFTVGDQLLWGAAEPIRRTLKIIVEHLLK